MKNKVIALVMIVLSIATILASCGKDNNDIFISDVTDNGNDSTNNTQIEGGDDTGGSGDNTVTIPLYAEKTQEDSLLGGWTTSNGDVYEFGNFDKLVVFNSADQSVVEYTYDTDGQTYVSLTSGDVTTTYVVKLSKQANSLGDEVEVLVLTKDTTNIILNKQYDIKKLNESIQ